MTRVVSNPDRSHQRLRTRGTKAIFSFQQAITSDIMYQGDPCAKIKAWTTRGWARDVAATDSVAREANHLRPLTRAETKATSGGPTTGLTDNNFSKEAVEATTISEEIKATVSTAAAT